VDSARLVTRAAQPARPASDFVPADPRRIEKVLALKTHEDRLEVEAQDDVGAAVPIDIRPVAPDIVRLHIGPGHDRPSRLLVEGAPASADWSLDEDAAGWDVYTSALSLRIDRMPYRLRLAGAKGDERFAEEREDRDIRGGYHHLPSGQASAPSAFAEGSSTPSPLRGGSGRGLAGSDLYWLTVALQPGESLFGLGEHFGALDRRGQAFASWTVDAFGVRSDRSYKNVPLLLSSRGYGVFFDMTAPLYYDLGQASVAAWQATARADHLRFYLIAGDGIAPVINGYQRLTGRPAVPPDWSFGFWISRWGYRNRDEVMAVARRMRQERIPCDVIHIDPYWMRHHEGHHGDFEWDESAFPDPKGMIDELRSMGFKVSLWESPYVPLDSEMCKEGASRRYLLKSQSASDAPSPPGESSGSPSPLGEGAGRGLALVKGFSKPSAAVDFTNPQAAEWFKEKNRKLLKLGIAVMKTDFAEDLPVDAVAHDGTPAEDLHNVYPLLYQDAVFESTREVHGYGLIWGRSGYAGSQRAPVHWGGDPGCTFNDMAASLRGALSWILSGAAFASFDIGGFFGFPELTDPPSPELYIRWAQMGLLFSHARAHGHTAPREPWAYGEPALSIFRRYAQLRYRLLPYLYSAALEATKGIPLVRPLVYDHPEDRTTHHIDDEYFLGPDLLVAPMFKPSGSRQVYLPSGSWYDYWTDRRHEGSRWINYEAELDRVPLFVRAGAVIAMGPDLQFANERSWDPLSFDLYLGNPGTRSFLLADDRRRLRLEVDTSDDRVLLSGGRLDYSAEVRLHDGRVDARRGKLGEPFAF
jgi:alpha-D-xyloside xylohydrolase